MQEQTGTPLTSAAPEKRSRRSYLAVLWAVMLLTVLVDQATKLWALHALAPGVERRFIGDVITFRLLRNSGAAFSVFDGTTYIVTAIALGIVAWILFIGHRRLASRAYAICLGLAAGGAVGNLIDRFLREPGVGRGHVVDFIDYFGMFVGNVADILIVGAAAMFFVLVQGGWRLDGTRSRHE